MPGSDQLKSVVRALDVLELIGNSVDGVRLRTLQQVFGQKSGAMHTLLRTLVNRGYLVKVEDQSRYILGSAAAVLDHRNLCVDLLKRTGPVIISICRQTGMVVLVQRMWGNTAFVLSRVRPETFLSVERSEYMSVPYGTSVIFQAYQTPQEQDCYWRQHPMDDLAKKLWGNLENLRKYLKLAARQRLAVIDSKADQKFRISAPIFDSDGKVVAAIAAYQLCSKISRQQAQLAAQLIHNAGCMLSATTQVSAVTKTLVHSPRFA